MEVRFPGVKRVWNQRSLQGLRGSAKVEGTWARESNVNCKGGIVRGVGAILLVSFLASGTTIVSPGERKPASLLVSDRVRQDWDSVDFTLLDDEIRLRSPEEDQDRRQVLFSLQFAFSNKMRMDRFLIPPQPQEFVGMVAEILRLNREAAVLIIEGRKLAAVSEFDASTSKKCKEVISEVGKLSRSLKKRFVSSFLEPRRATVDVTILQERGVNAFRFYLLQADKLNRQLTEEIDSYFLDPNPGSIEVPELGQASILVLTEAMIRLSDTSLKWID